MTNEERQKNIELLENEVQEAFKEKNIYVFEQLIQHVSNIIDIIYRLED